MRDAGIQILRVLSMIFIVFYHCLCYYGIWGIFPEHVEYSNIGIWRSACNLALTTFVFISGYLYGHIYQTGKYSKPYKTFKTKTNRLLIPYLLWGLLLVMIFPAVSDISHLSIGISHLWFLLMMYMLFLLIILLRDKILHVPILIAAIILSYGIDIVATKRLPDGPSFLAWRITLHYLPAFLWGILCIVCKLPKKLTKWRSIIFYLVYAIISICVLATIIKESLPFGLLYIEPVRYIWLLFTYVILTDKLSSTTTHPLLVRLDKHSMGIYIIHHILIWVVLIYIPPVLPIMNQHYILAPIVLFVGVFIVSWLLSEAMHRHKYTRYLIGSK